MGSTNQFILLFFYYTEGDLAMHGFLASWSNKPLNLLSTVFILGFSLIAPATYGAGSIGYEVGTYDINTEDVDLDGEAFSVSYRRTLIAPQSVPGVLYGEGFATYGNLDGNQSINPSSGDSQIHYSGDAVDLGLGGAWEWSLGAQDELLFSIQAGLAYTKHNYEDSNVSFNGTTDSVQIDDGSVEPYAGAEVGYVLSDQSSLSFRGRWIDGFDADVDTSIGGIDDEKRFDQQSTLTVAYRYWF